MTKKLNNLQRHLWLLRIPGLIAAVLVLNDYPMATVYLALETMVTAAVAMALAFMPAHQVARLVPAPVLGLQYAVLMALYLLADMDALVGVNLLLWVVLLCKHREHEASAVKQRIASLEQKVCVLTAVSHAREVLDRVWGGPSSIKQEGS